MTTRQQDEALAYFNAHAADWRAKADGLKVAKVNVIEQRNGFVEQVATERQQTSRFLDVGCGTGELVCAIAALGIEATGIDYAQEMIDLASAKAADLGLAAVHFACSSVFDVELAAASYDLISANGFIEYLSTEETARFFALVATALAPGGSFVVGSRNRLFNLVSMNDYTAQEVASGDLELLVQEAVAWSTAGGLEDVAGKDVAGIKTAPVQTPSTEHASTGIDVAARFQYTPLQLIGMLNEQGLAVEEVYPVHVHGVTPTFARAHPEVHVSIANLLQAQARNETRMLSQASSFMLHVSKAG